MTKQPLAYYNEIDPYCAQWLRNLISKNLIAPGHVDERSILDVKPYELEPYTQCHFFAGIGGWSYALRLAGVPDHRKVWTGSCPCQPFSLAGSRRGFADDRHLWPYWRYLIAQRRPPEILGEQVASASQWLRLVRGDLETLGYAVGCVPIEAASAGADHLRDRYWFVGYCDGAERRQDAEGRRDVDDWANSRRQEAPSGFTVASGTHSAVAHSSSTGFSFGAGDGRVQQEALGTPARQTVERNGAAGHVSDAERERVRGQGPGSFVGTPSGVQGTNKQREWIWPDAGTVCDDRSSDMANGNLDGTSARRSDFSETFGFQETQREPEFGAALFGRSGDGCASEQGSDCQWVIGADGKARRVKPGIRLLAHDVPSRVAKLRAFGNAIVPQVAARFIKAALDL